MFFFFYSGNNFFIKFNIYVYMVQIIDFMQVVSIAHQPCALCIQVNVVKLNILHQVKLPNT